MAEIRNAPLHRAVLFDIDGTLVQSNDAHARAWEQALREHDVRVSFEQVRKLIGTGGDKLLAEVAGIDHESDIGRRITSRRKELFGSMLGTLRPTKGVVPLLRRLKDGGVRLAVATSAEKDEVHTLLQIAGAAPFIEERASADEAPHSKPDPDVLHAALSKTGTDSSDAVMVGDTPYDLEAAKRAGMAIVVLRCGGWWTDEQLTGANAIYDDPQDLLEHLNESPLVLGG